MLQRVFGPEQFSGTATFYARMTQGEDYSTNTHPDLNPSQRENVWRNLDHHKENLVAICISADPKTFYLKHPYIKQKTINGIINNVQEKGEQGLKIDRAIYQIPEKYALLFKNMSGLLDYLILTPRNEQVFYCGQRSSYEGTIYQINLEIMNFLDSLDDKILQAITPENMFPTILDFQRRPITQLILTSYIKPLLIAKRENQLEKYETLIEALIMLGMPNLKILGETDRLLELLQKPNDEVNATLMDLTSQKINAMHLREKKVKIRLGRKIRKIERKTVMKHLS